MKTEFNPNKKEFPTYGECLEPAMAITDEADAQQYLEDYTAFVQSKLDRKPRRYVKTAAEIARDNLSYFAGYYDNATRERVERLFKCAHPVFGSISKNGAPTAEEAFEAGKRMGARL